MSGGALPLSLERRRQLEELFAGWRSPPADPTGLAEAIDRACAWNELAREEEKGSQSAGELRSNLLRYQKALAKARDISEQFPRAEAEAMQSTAMLYRDQRHKLPPELCRQLALVDAPDLLRLLEDLVDNYLEQHAAPAWTRRRHDMWLVQEVAKACDAHGVRVGAGENGHFHQIIKTVMANVGDQRDLIRQALGKNSRK